MGLLLRFGPQHGYQIKKLMEEQLEDFTQIKLPTVYYHLEKLEAAGFLTAHRDKQEARPEKTVYRVSDAGACKFRELLTKSLQIEYRPTFDIDGAFYFSDAMETDSLTKSLAAHIANLEQILGGLERHRKETLACIPEEHRISADIIFEHHILHYQAERSWAQRSLDHLKEAQANGETAGH